MPSKLGIHGIMAGDSLDFLQDLLAAGATMATIKAVEGPGWLKNVKQFDVTVQTVGRFTRGADGSMDVEGPRLDGDLRKSAQEVMINLFPRWEEHRTYVDYWEIINEQDPPGPDGHRRLAEFMGHCMDIAEPEGYKLALFSYSLGVPEWDEMQTVVETGIFGRAKAGGHALALHEYAYPMDVWFGEPLPGRPRYPDRGPLACRYRWWYEDFLKTRDEVIPLFLTEVNLARDLPLVTIDEWMTQMAWYDARLREDYYVVGAHIFTLGSGGGWQNYDFTAMLPRLKEHILALKDVVDPQWPEAILGPPPEIIAPPVPTPIPPTPPEEPAPIKPPGRPSPIPSPVKPFKPAPTPIEPTEKTPVACQPREPFERHYLLLPPNADWRWVAACQGYWEKFRVTIGSSADDAAYGPGLMQRAVTAVNPALWGDDLRGFFDKHYPGVKYDVVVAGTPQELERQLNWRVAHNRRFG